MIQRKLIQVSGIVQGVGFRPFIYGLARRLGLNGTVCNNERGVLLDVEGTDTSVEQLVRQLSTEAPPLARIDRIECITKDERAFYADFQIIDTARESRVQKLIPIAADVATCAECVGELFDPADRRFRYPFINCTNCGPRFTIIQDVPYDRVNTTMHEFEMCVACRAEYENPLDRRFHAEPIACAICGPSLRLIANDEKRQVLAERDDALTQALLYLAKGRIVAIKGIGGFHLACDAMNKNAVRELRQRKYREEKPFALMANSVAVVQDYCELTDDELQLLLSPERPIVLLRRKTDAAIPEAVAPRINSLGFMLPYSPLHYLLLEKFDRPLVMTSANISDEPICYDDDEALQRLAKIADYYLLHNRAIHMRTDDSVMRVISVAQQANAGSTQKMLLRRARGFAPAPIRTAFSFRRQILACGAELKNTFCLTRDNSAFISHHIGDLENVETLRSFTKGIEHFKRLFYLNPEVIAYDLHPEYLSTKYALSVDAIETKIGIQHHHAHIASCMADNEIDGDVIGVAMDGLGFGADGRLWGGEFLLANFVEAERAAHLDHISMPGGAKAIREPWRMAAMYLQQAFGDEFMQLDIPFVQELDKRKWQTLRRMTTSSVNSPDTSSMGRLFDAVASLLRLRDCANYEGQAAIELEQIAKTASGQPYQFRIEPDGCTISAKPVIRSVVQDLIEHTPASLISGRFHSAVSSLIVTMAQMIRERHNLNRVVMSGGVFQNVVLLNAACEKLGKAGFQVFTHKRVPANDGGICLGQAAIANAQLARKA